MADQAGDVDAQPGADGVEVLRVGLQLHGTPASKVASGMSSICLNMPARARTSARFTGASDSEQLPISTVVTPCSSDGVARRSQQICGS
ncbi:MAG: hypothetical protein U0802_02250 [Candidatus Binatia bacterium]